MTADSTTRPLGSPREWDSWYSRNASCIGSDDYGYEVIFARRVLPGVRGLSPLEVTPQKEVLLQGRLRRIDFAVERPGLKVAIEIDGWDKSGTGTGMDRAQHQDFLERQNALVLAGWTPLRFTPKEVRDNPAAVARGVQSALDRTRTAPQPQASPGVQASSGPSAQRGTAPTTAVAAGRGAPSAVVPGHVPATRHTGKWIGGGLAAVALIGLGLGFGLFGPAESSTISCAEAGVVRGNVSQSGELIYHLPGDRYYEVTRPEECFANPADAQAQGYRRAEV